MADEVRDAKREAKKAVKKAATVKERVDSLANKRVSRLRTSHCLYDRHKLTLNFFFS
jgi:hypothetical protein